MINEYSKYYANIRYDEERRALAGSMQDDTGEIIEVVLKWANLRDKDGKKYSPAQLRMMAEVE